MILTDPAVPRRARGAVRLQVDERSIANARAMGTVRVARRDARRSLVNAQKCMCEARADLLDIYPSLADPCGFPQGSDWRVAVFDDCFRSLTRIGTIPHSPVSAQTSDGAHSVNARHTKTYAKDASKVIQERLAI